MRALLFLVFFFNCRCFHNKQLTQNTEYSRHHSVLKTFFFLFTLLCKNVQNMILKFRGYPLVCLLPTLQIHLRQLLIVTSHSQSQSHTTSSELRIFLHWWCMVVFPYCQRQCYCTQYCGASFERWSACRIRNKWATLQNDEKDCYSLTRGLNSSHSFF